MKFLSNIISKITPKKRACGVPDSLKKIIDRYDMAAVLTVYDANSPLILYTNKKHKKLTGYSPKELIGKTPKELQGKNTSDKIRKEIRDGLHKSSFWNGHVINYQKNGEEISINLVIFAICYEGHKYYVALKKMSSEE